MNPEEMEKLISRYHDPDLTDFERNRINQVLAADPNLRQILQQYHRLDQALAQLPDGLDDVDFTEFTGRVSTAVAAVPAPHIPRLILRRYLAPLAAAVILVALTLDVINPNLTNNNTPQIVSEVTLAPPQRLLGETLVQEIGIILEPAGVAPPILTEEGGVICSVGPAAKPIRNNIILERGLLGLIPDGSP